jgi:hypothetical protein
MLTPPHGWRMADGETDGGSATEIPGLGCVHVSTRKAGAASSRRYALSPLSSVRPCRRVPLAHLSKRCIHLIIRVTSVCVAALCLFDNLHQPRLSPTGPMHLSRCVITRLGHQRHAVGGRELPTTPSSTTPATTSSTAGSSSIACGIDCSRQPCLPDLILTAASPSASVRHASAQRA